MFRLLSHAITLEEGVSRGSLGFPVREQASSITGRGNQSNTPSTISLPVILHNSLPLIGLSAAFRPPAPAAGISKQSARRWPQNVLQRQAGVLRNQGAGATCSGPVAVARRNQGAGATCSGPVAVGACREPALGVSVPAGCAVATSTPHQRPQLA